VILPRQIVAIRELGDTEDSYWAPASSNGSDLLLEPGEMVLATGRGQVASKGSKSWTLPFATIVILTNRRLAFMTLEFDKGGGWTGFGIAGAAVAVGANAVSKHRAQNRSAGKVLIGHLRHEWVTDLGFRHQKKLIGQNFYVDVTYASAVGSAKIVLTGNAAMADVANAYAKACAGAQLLVTEDGIAQTTLRRYADGEAEPATSKGPNDRTWRFSGDAASRIEAVQRLVAD
jgi:hypothetical protein